MLTLAVQLGIVWGSIHGKEKLQIADHRINRQIRAREVLLIDAAGVKRGSVPIQEALQEAEEAGLDLVEVAGNEVPPVCKIMDYGKVAYQDKKKKTHVKSGSDMKEISFSMKISEHDIDTKLKKAREFVEKGHKLRFNLILRGRERAYADTNGLTQLRRLVQKMADVAQVEQMSSQMLGNRLFAILAPAKVKPVKSAPKNPVIPADKAPAIAAEKAPVAVAEPQPAIAAEPQQVQP